MIKQELSPLEVLDNLLKDICYEHNVVHKFPDLFDIKNTNEYKEVETVLKEGEEAKKIINILKEVIQFGRTLPEIKPNNKNGFDILQSVGLRVQRDIENEERKQLREWVLKTCFPKELADYEKKTKLAKEYKDVNNVAKRLKAFEIITKTFDFDIELGSLPNGTPTYKLNVWCKGSPIVVKPISKEEFDLLKEELK